MIVDAISNAGLYTGLGDRISRALALLASEEFRGMEPGKREVEGTSLYYIVMSYESKPLSQGKWESHRKYIDVQYVAEGVEKIGWAPADSLTVTMPYDAAKDAALYEGEGNLIAAPAGTFFVLWPDDAHMPGVAAGSPSAVRKIVVKILL